MISHILFDNNGVLTTSDGEKTHQAVADYLKIDRSDVNALFAPDVRALDTGAITQKEFYRRVIERGKFKVSVREFERLHLNSYIAKSKNQKLAKLLSKHYPTYLLTNFGDAFWKMYPKWGLDGVFEKKNVFLSAELGLAKPDPAIFNYVLKKLNIAAENVVFIDDNSDNIRSAKNLGIHTVLYKGHDELVSSLMHLGIKT
jgi:putative hydrolase of the HAD superfamily